MCSTLSAMQCHNIVHKTYISNLDETKRSEKFAGELKPSGKLPKDFTESSQVQNDRVESFQTASNSTDESSLIGTPELQHSLLKCDDSFDHVKSEAPNSHVAQQNSHEKRPRKGRNLVKSIFSRRVTSNQESSLVPRSARKTVGLLSESPFSCQQVSGDDNHKVRTSNSVTTTAIGHSCRQTGVKDNSTSVFQSKKCSVIAELEPQPVQKKAANISNMKESQNCPPHKTKSTPLAVKIQKETRLCVRDNPENEGAEVSGVKDSHEDSYLELVGAYTQCLKALPLFLYSLFRISVLYLAGAVLLISLLLRPGTMREIVDFRSGPFVELFCLVGLLVATKFVFVFLSFLYGKLVSNDRFLKKSGQWAVVTGCTNGIGKEYALQLAAKGVNVCLISRNTSLLLALARQIANEYRVRTMVITADFSSGLDQMYEDIKWQLRHFDIGILVNNVGVVNDVIDVYHKNTSEEMASRLINVNVTAMTRMTHMILPGMKERGRGIIINISSGFGRSPTCLLALYSASKKFADQFSLALNEEYRQFCVTIQSVTPYFVSTNMTKNVRTGFLIPSASAFVKSALSTVGRQSRTHGYWPHTLQGLVLRNLPEWMRMAFMTRLRHANGKLTLKHKQKDTETLTLKHISNGSPYRGS